MGRVLGLIGVMITMAVGMYIYSVQLQGVRTPTSTSGSEAAVTITGVKNDLIAIANAERGYVAEQGRYASLDELMTGKYITVRSERPPYVYDCETTPNGFRVTATRSSPGRPAQLWIDETMEIQTSN